MKKRDKKPRRFLTIALIAVVVAGVLGAGAVFGVNAWVKGSVEDRILSQQQAAELEDVDCIVVLGCWVRDDGTPSHMLEDRLKQSVALYQQGAAPKLLMSGDHGTETYDEVATMKQYALDAGIPSENVFMDHAGFSTYETIYRAKDIFCADKIIIVTQEYHLYRALYIARELGIDAYGVSADYRDYSGQFARDVREVLARVKDFGMTILKPEPTYRGETIPITGNGDATHDETTNFTPKE